MRIGVFVGDLLVEDGGGTTLRAGIVDTLEALSYRHEFILFYPNGDNPPTLDAAPIPSFHIIRRAISSSSLLGPAARFMGQMIRQGPAALEGHPEPGISREERRVRDFAIDVAWFLTPWNEPIGVPYIATVWDLEHRRQPYFPEVSTTGWLWEDREHNYRRLLPRAARVLTGTNAGKKEIVSYYGINPEIVHVVPFPADYSFSSPDKVVDVRRKFGLANGFVFYPAQFWPHKNHVNLLMALQLVNANLNDPLQLVLTGSDKGNLQFVKETILQLGLQQQVRILGFVSREDMIGLYHEAAALVYPSFFGPDNLPPLEAFAMGCPVTAAKVAGADEQLGDAALLFDPANPADIAAAMRRMQNDQILRAELIQRGRKQVATRTPKNYVERVCDLIDDFEPIRRCWGRQAPLNETV